MNSPVAVEQPGLLRALGMRDVYLITCGSMLGSAIFIAAAMVPRALPHPALIIAAWIFVGLLTLAGALTYAELGTMFPRAGGQYQYLKEAFGPLSGFLFGWASFFLAQSAGNAYVAIAFGEYLGAFVPAVSTGNIVFSLPLGFLTWQVNAVQAVAALAVVVLTAINYFGVRQGVGVQNAMTFLKLAAVMLIGVVGFASPSATPVDWTAPLPDGNLLLAFGVAAVGINGAYDGWYLATFSAGEIRDPDRNLPRGLVLGVLTIIVVYGLVNLVYLRALPLAELGAAPRIGEAATAALFGSSGGMLMALIVLLSLFGSLATGVLSTARIYQPMAEDGVFFRTLAAIHPRYRTPAASLVAQGIWTVVLALLGTFEQLLGYSMFVIFLFHAATALALFRLRRTRPDARRAYRVWGYPWVPGLFLLASVLFVGSTFIGGPREAIIGVGLVALGIPAYLGWRRGGARAAGG